MNNKKYYISISHWGLIQVTEEQWKIALFTVGQKVETYHIENDD